MHFVIVMELCSCTFKLIANMSEKQAVFPPEVLARIAPDISLQRHLAHGIRPSLRELDEFRPLSASTGSLNNLGTNSVVGLAVVTNGNAQALCGITLGITEINQLDELLSNPDDALSYSTVYPVVEIARGRSGAPSDEEMILGQKLYNHILHLRILPQLLLEISPGYQLKDEATGETSIVYPEQDSDLLSLSSTVNITKKKYKFVIYAHISVVSRTGPLFDLVHYALISALRNTELPKVYLADSGIDPNVRVPVRSRGNFGHLTQSSSLFCVDANPAIKYPLALSGPDIAVSSTFGVVDLDGSVVMLADLEGEAEEYCAESKINVVSTGKVLKHVSVAGGGANVTLDTLRKAVRIANKRTDFVHNGRGA